MKKKDILISVVLINFNNKLGLEKTLGSIKNQVASCFEIIYVDGGSTDGSLDVANSYTNFFSVSFVW